MKKRSVEYPFEIRPLSKEEGGGYGISFPDLPGCRADGATPENAIENGRDAIESWLAIAKEFGDAIPKSYSAVSGKFVQRVPRSLHAQLITQAQSEGVSLNTLVVSLVSQGLGRRSAPAQARSALATRSSQPVQKAKRKTG